MPKTSTDGLIINQSTPTKNANKEASASVDNTTQTIEDYVGEFTRWREKLRPFWKNIKKEQDLYEFYKAEHEEVESNISLNTPFSIVESMVSKANEASINVTVSAKGENNLLTFESWISAILKQAIQDPETAEIHGSFRKIRESYFREFLVKGNAVAAINWCYESTDGDDGKEKVVADNPYVKVLPLFSVVFNPSKTLSSSDVYYVESWVSYAMLKKAIGRDGKAMYKNLDHLASFANQRGKVIDSKIAEEQVIVGDQKIPRQVEPIHILERWEGSQLTVIADDMVEIRNEKDPLKIGTHNLLTSMNYVIEGRPLAYGEISAIYKPVRTQDTIINQSIDIVNRYLRPAYVVDSTLDPNIFIDLIENGGVIQGRTNQPSFLPIAQNLPTPPPQAFNSIDLLQQAIERTARYSPYASGVPSQSTDKTNGTASGINSLQAAAEPNFQIKLDALQDTFMSPLARKYLRMIANNMDGQELRYGLLEGKDPGWVKATKGILVGRTTINELAAAEIITPEQAQSYTHTLIDTVDGLGNPAKQLVPIPGADKSFVFNVDWLVSIRLDNQSAAQKQEKFDRRVQLIQLAKSLGAQFDVQKVMVRLAQEEGIEDPESFLPTAPPMPQMMPMGAPQGQMPPPQQPSMPPQGPMGVPMGAPSNQGNQINA